MNNIKVLPIQLANQIAAGEVVERPASVVKELIENSIDAGAKNITIEITGGGSKKIVIHDDGSGISETDMPLAVARHATSKLQNIDDLYAITTMGFRGEALASIASVSEFEIASNTQDELGYKIAVAGDSKDIKLQAVKHNKGTTIKVENLFFNTPARRKFLKTENTEFIRIQNIVKKLALSSYDIAFTLKHNDKTRLDIKSIADKQDIKRRIGSILGNNFLEQSLFLDICNSSNLRIWGWTGLPTMARSQTDMQYFFINARIVSDKVVSHAIRQAYHDVLFNKLHPTYLLYLEIDPAQLDINVHPTKSEVRFYNSQTIHSFVFNAIESTLAKSKPSKDQTINRGNISIDKFNISSDINNTNSQHSANNNSTNHIHRANNTNFQSHSKAPNLSQQWLVYDAPSKNSGDYSYLTDISNIKPDVENNTDSNYPPLGYALAQVNQLFILAQAEDGLIIVDTHAAHERIIYEKMKKSWHKGGDKHKKYSQSLAIPLAIDVSNQQLTTFIENEQQIEKLGFDIRQTTPDTISVFAYPSIIKINVIKDLVLEILKDFDNSNHSKSTDNTINSILGNMACRAAIRGQTKLSIDQMNSILRDIETTDRSNQCNHGRPTYVQLNMRQLDSLFLRGK